MAKKSSNSGTLYDVKVPVQGFVTLEGDIVETMAHAIVFRYRRPGSSKWERRTIPRDKIVLMPVDDGRIGKLVYLGTQNAIRLRKATIEGTDKGHPAFVRVQDEKGVVMLVRSEYMDAVTVTEIDAPADASKKKKEKTKEKKTSK